MSVCGAHIRVLKNTALAVWVASIAATPSTGEVTWQWDSFSVVVWVEGKVEGKTLLDPKA